MSCPDEYEAARVVWLSCVVVVVVVVVVIRNGRERELCRKSVRKKVSFPCGVVNPSAVLLLERWNGESWCVVVEKLPVDAPPFFGASWKLFQLRSELVLVVAVGSSKCVVSVLSCLVVVGLSLRVLLCVDCLFACVVQPWV